MEKGVLYAELRDSKNNWCSNKIFVEFDKHYNNCDGTFFPIKININEPSKNSWCVLLTTAIKTISNDEKDAEFRKNLYLMQIEKWLKNTNYFIFIVESTGNGFEFDDIEKSNAERIKVISLKLESSTSSSILEAKSIKEAMNYILTTSVGQNCTHVLKVTGRYLLEDVQNKLENITPNADVYIQIHTNHSNTFQNTEYYGIKKELFIPMVETVIENGKLMEHNFYEYITENRLKKCILGPFENNIRRGGDKMLLNYL